MPHESDSSRANPHNAVALTQLIRRVNNAVACRSTPRPRTGCDDRAGSAHHARSSVQGVTATPDLRGVP
jgi:hypothetical protein